MADANDICILKILCTILVSCVALVGILWVFANNPTYWKEASWALGIFLVVSLMGIHATGEWVRKK